MRRVRFSVGRVASYPSTNVALIPDGEDVAEEVLRQAWDDLQIQVEITISGVTMHAAAWENPEHWATDWAEKLDVDFDDAPDAVLGLLEQALAGDGQ